MNYKIRTAYNGWQNPPSLDFFVWRMLLLTFFLVLAYAAYAVVVRPDHPFLRPAVQGEILILSALIMIDASYGLSAVPSRYERPLILFALLLVGWFAIAKYLLISSSNQSNAEMNRLRWALGFFNLALTVCSVVGSIYVCSVVSRDAASDQVTNMTLQKTSWERTD